MTYDVEARFHMLSCHLYSFFCEMSIQLFCQFLNQVVHVFNILINILLDLYLSISFLSCFFFFWCQCKWHWAYLIAQLVKNLAAMQETLVRFLGWEDPLEKATHSSILGLPLWLS